MNLIMNPEKAPGLKKRAMDSRYMRQPSPLEQQFPELQTNSTFNESKFEMTGAQIIGQTSTWSNKYQYQTTANKLGSPQGVKRHKTPIPGYSGFVPHVKSEPGNYGKTQCDVARDIGEIKDEEEDQYLNDTIGKVNQTFTATAPLGDFSLQNLFEANAQAQGAELNLYQPVTYKKSPAKETLNNAYKTNSDLFFKNPHDQPKRNLRTLDPHEHPLQYNKSHPESIPPGLQSITGTGYHTNNTFKREINDERLVSREIQKRQGKKCNFPQKEAFQKTQMDQLKVAREKVKLIDMEDKQRQMVKKVKQQQVQGSPSTNLSYKIMENQYRKQQEMMVRDEQRRNRSFDGTANRALNRTFESRAKTQFDTIALKNQQMLNNARQGKPTPIKAQHSYAQNTQLRAALNGSPEPKQLSSLSSVQHGYKTPTHGNMPQVKMHTNQTPNKPAYLSNQHGASLPKINMNKSAMLTKPRPQLNNTIKNDDGYIFNNRQSTLEVTLSQEKIDVPQTTCKVVRRDNKRVTFV